MKTKRFLSLALALMLSLSLLTIPAFATVDEPATPVKDAGLAAAEEGIAKTTDVVVTPTAGAPTGAVGTPASYPSGSYTLNLTSGKLIPVETTTGTPDFTIAGYSVDGGTKWKVGSPDEKAIDKLLKSGGKLVLSDKMDGKVVHLGKAAVVANAEEGIAAEDAVAPACLLTFAEIKGAEKAKLTANYLIYADASGKTAGKWTVTLKDDIESADAAKDLAASILVAYSTDGKTPVELEVGGNKYTYGVISGGVDVVETLLEAKPGKRTYLVKTAPVQNADGSYTASSPVVKVKVQDQIKAPKLKADYKKELMKLKAGTSVFLSQTVASFDGVPESTAALVAANGSFASTIANGVVYALDKEAAKTNKTITLTDLLTETETYAYAWTAATAKKPASIVQSIKLAPRAVIGNVTYTGVKGKVKPDKIYEFYNTEKQKYSSFPKVTASVTNGRVRLKNTAKASKDSAYTGNAASIDGVLGVDYGVWEPEREKSGILFATITAPAYDGKVIAANAASPAFVTSDSATFVISFSVTGLGTDTLLDYFTYTIKRGEADLTEDSGVTSGEGAIGISLPAQSLGTDVKSATYTLTLTPIKFADKTPAEAPSKYETYAAASTLTVNVTVEYEEAAGTVMGKIESALGVILVEQVSTLLVLGEVPDTDAKKLARLQALADAALVDVKATGFTAKVAAGTGDDAGKYVLTVASAKNEDNTAERVISVTFAMPEAEAEWNAAAKTITVTLTGGAKFESELTEADFTITGGTAGTITGVTNTDTTATITYSTVPEDGNYTVTVKAAALANYKADLVTEAFEVLTKYTLTFSANGGTGTAPAAVEYAKGEAVTFPAKGDLAKENYTFEGWATADDATTALTEYTMPGEATTLYAVWVAETP